MRVHREKIDALSDDEVGLLIHEACMHLEDRINCGEKFGECSLEEIASYKEQLHTFERLVS